VTKSEAGELARNARVLQKASRLPAAPQEAQRLQEEANAALAEAEVLKPQARLDDLTAYVGWRRSKQSERAPGPTHTGWHPGAKATGRAMCTWGAPGRWMLRKPARKPGKRKAEALGWSPMDSSISIKERNLSGNKNLLIYVKEDCFDRIGLAFDNIYT